MPSAGTTGCVGPHVSDPFNGPAAADAAAGNPVLDLRHYVRHYDDNLPAQLCTKLISSFNELGGFQQRNGRGVRPGLEQSAWTEMDIGRLADADFLQFFRDLVSQALRRYNNDAQLPIALPDSPLLSPLILKRYRAGQDRFQTHFDSINTVCDRYLVFLWYLNDVTDGGQTWFPGLDTGIAPRRGRLLMFPPYWMYAHQGQSSPTQDKYILSTYLRFPQR